MFLRQGYTVKLSFRVFHEINFQRHFMKHEILSWSTFTLVYKFHCARFSPIKKLCLQRKDISSKICDILCYLFLLTCDIKVKVLLSFKMNSKQFCSFDNLNLLLRGYYLFGFWLLLALKLTISIIGRSDMVGRGWKNFAKLIMWSLY